MGSRTKATVPPTIVKAPPLVTALTQSEQIKGKVEECAQELSTINEVLKQQVNEPLPLAQVQEALHQSEEVEVKVQECADDLSVVNQALEEEIRERKKLERKLAANTIQLADAQADLSDSQAQEERARHLAFHDVVTGLPNRLLFNDRLKTAVAQARRHGWGLAVMFIDLDQFKNINDSYGHDVGDKVLQIVSGRLQDSVRGEDTVARQGGDEFLYLMLEITNEADVAKVASHIIAKISQPCECNGVTLTVKPSIGISLYPQDGKAANSLRRNADSAMYKAKQTDTGYAFFAPRGDGSL